MRFELLPVLSIMLDFYKKPRGYERFKGYLSLLIDEDASDIDLPIAVYNPQESFVNKRTGISSNTLSMKEIASYGNYYKENKLAVDFPTIFNFFYGEGAAREFGYMPRFKCKEYSGFRIAHLFTEHQP